MNQQELLQQTGNGDDIPRFAHQLGLDVRQTDAVALYATTRGMTSTIHLDHGRVVFLHGNCPPDAAQQAVDGVIAGSGSDFVIGGHRLRVTRSPYADMYAVHVLTKVAPE